MLEYESKPIHFRDVPFLKCGTICAEPFKVSVEHTTYFVVSLECRTEKLVCHEMGKF
jgi:hypothetical protein